MSKNNTVLNSKERRDAQFLTSLAAALSNYDFSGKNFCKFGPHSYCLMVDNYQIKVGQTGVFYYPNKFQKFLGNAKYAFEPGKYERYEIYVYEHPYPMQKLDSDELLLGTPIGTGVWRLFMGATMATDKGVYRTCCFDTRPDYMFNQQNALLFAPARLLYNIFQGHENAVTDKKIIEKTPYELRAICNRYELAKRRKGLLDRINSENQKRQK